jgi:response regulator RpfG family c-di-GMP phosphodiesterase
MMDKVILLIDDQEINLLIIKNLLRIYNYNILYAQTLDDAYLVLNLNKIDLFIVDHYLDDGTFGIDFLKSEQYKLAKENGSKSIYHSIEYKSELIKEVEDLGVKFIQKVFNDKSLVYEINKMLN